MLGGSFGSPNGVLKRETVQFAFAIALGILEDLGIAYFILGGNAFRWPMEPCNYVHELTCQLASFSNLGLDSAPAPGTDNTVPIRLAAFLRGASHA
jgi:hypothetical protein